MSIEELRKTLSEDRKAGGRLLLKESKPDEKYGPYRVIGNDSRGRRFRMYGTPEFLLEELRAALKPYERVVPDAWRKDIPYAGPPLSESLAEEKALGAKLRLVSTDGHKDGPLRLCGTDSRGRTVNIIGDEDLIARMVSTWWWLEYAKSGKGMSTIPSPAKAKEKGAASMATPSNL